MVSWEDTQYCPKCKLRGEVAGKRPNLDGSTVYTITCKNERCSWYDTGWIVQRKPDGSIPERQSGPKEYEPLNTAFAKKEIERLEEELQRGES